MWELVLTLGGRLVTRRTPSLVADDACRACSKPHQDLGGHPWSVESEALCKRCWRWGTLWFVGQPAAADRQATGPYDP